MDVFRRQSQLDKEMEQARLANILAGYTNTIKAEEARYAPQMSQEELRKIQLANMIQQAKAKYAEQQEQASLQDVLAGIGVKNQNARHLSLLNQYLPREKEAAIAMAEMKNKSYPEEVKKKDMKLWLEIQKKQTEINKLQQEMGFAPKKDERAERIANARIASLQAGVPLTEERVKELQTKNKYGDRQQAADTLIRENQAKYAPAMSEATLLDLLLGNEGKQISNQYAQPMAEANYDNLLLRNEGQRINNQYEPEIAKGNIEKTRLGNVGQTFANKKAEIDNEYLRQEKESNMKMQDAKLKQEQFKVDNAPQVLENETIKAMAYAKQAENLRQKHLSEVSRIQSQINQLKENRIDPVTGKKLNPRQQQDYIFNLRKELDKKLTIEPTKRFLEQIGTTLIVIDRLDPETISKNYGLKAQAKMLGKKFIKPLGYNDEMMNEFERFTKQTAPLIASQLRNAFVDSVQKPAAQKYLDQISPNKWKQNPVSALAYLKEFINLTRDETAGKLMGAPREGYYRQEQFKNYNLIPGDIVPENADALAKRARELLAAQGAQ